MTDKFQKMAEAIVNRVFPDLGEEDPIFQVFGVSQFKAARKRWIGPISEALQSQHDQHEREVDELRAGMAEVCQEYTDALEKNAEEYARTAAVETRTRMISAFDRIRAQQSEKGAKQEGIEVNL